MLNLAQKLIIVIQWPCRSQLPKPSRSHKSQGSKKWGMFKSYLNHIVQKLLYAFGSTRNETI